MEQKSMIFYCQIFNFGIYLSLQTNIKLEKNNFSRYQTICQKGDSNQDKNEPCCEIYDS